jgi:hypothetical protein
MFPQNLAIFNNKLQSPYIANFIVYREIKIYQMFFISLDVRKSQECKQ